MASILYVDDEEAIRRAVATWLTRRGHVVHAAGSISAALDLLESQSVDGAFVDLWIGGESGLELREWIDKHRPDLSANVVLVTGDPGSSGQLGRPILAKPFELTELDAFVARWMGRG
jgi:DNA-binding NtrC family response regulator